MTGGAAAFFKGALILALEAADRLGPRRDVLPVLNYHAVDGDESPTSLPPRLFRRHMDVLASRGVRVVTFREVVSLLKRPGPLPGNTACITFDDGMRTVFTEAFPLMRERGFRATVFLTTGAEDNRVSWERDPAIRPRPLLDGDQVRELHAEGFEIGGHTLTHPHLTELDDASLRREIEKNRDDVTALCGEAPATFAYPYGDYDERVIGALERAGYEGACTVKLPGRRMGRDPFAVERIDVSRFSRHSGRLADLSFRSCLSGVFADYVRIKSIVPFTRARTFEYKERMRRDASRR